MGWIFGIFGFIVLLFMGGIGFLIYKVVKKSTRKQKPEEIKEITDKLQADAREAASKLDAWGNKKPEDLSVSMRYTYKKGLAHRMKGKIHSISNAPVIAFTRYERGLYADGYVAAATDAFEYFYKIKKGEVFDIFLNKERLGKIEADGSIYDAQGNHIGHAKHPTKVSFDVGIVSGRAGDNVFPLTMNGRVLAQIMVAPNHSDMPSASVSVSVNENNYGIQTLRNIDNPSAEEEKWLLAMAILETAFHGHWMI